MKTQETQPECVENLRFSMVKINLVDFDRVDFAGWQKFEENKTSIDSGLTTTFSESTRK